MGIRSFLFNWLAGNRKPTPGPTLASINESDTPTDKMMRIEIKRASNGHVVNVMQYKFNPHGPDWTGSLYVVAEGESVMDVIKLGLASKALE